MSRAARPARRSQRRAGKRAAGRAASRHCRAIIRKRCCQLSSVHSGPDTVPNVPHASSHLFLRTPSRNNVSFRRDVVAQRYSVTFP